MILFICFVNCVVKENNFVVGNKSDIVIGDIIKK